MQSCVASSARSCVGSCHVLKCARRKPARGPTSEPTRLQALCGIIARKETAAARRLARRRHRKLCWAGLTLGAQSVIRHDDGSSTPVPADHCNIGVGCVLNILTLAFCKAEYGLSPTIWGLRHLCSNCYLRCALYVGFCPLCRHCIRGEADSKGDICNSNTLSGVCLGAVAGLVYAQSVANAPGRLLARLNVLPLNSGMYSVLNSSTDPLILLRAEEKT